MAGYYGKIIIEWKCLKPEIYHEEHGYIEEVGCSLSEASDKFKENNPDYDVISVKFKEE